MCLNLFQLRITNWSTCIVTNPRITGSFTDKQNTVSWPWLQHHRSVYWCGMSLYQNNDKDDITRWGRAGSGHWHSPDTAERPRAERGTLDSGHDDTSPALTSVNTVWAIIFWLTSNEINSYCFDQFIWMQLQNWISKSVKPGFVWIQWSLSRHRMDDVIWQLWQDSVLQYNILTQSFLTSISEVALTGTDSEQLRTIDCEPYAWTWGPRGVR